MPALTVTGTSAFDTGLTAIMTQGLQTYNGAVTLGTDTSLTSGADNSPGFLFGSTIDDSTPLTDTLTLNAGSVGGISIVGDVGDSAPLAALTIANAADVSAAKIDVGSFTQEAGTGTTTLGSWTTSSSGGVSLATDNVTISGGITIAPGSGGPVAITTTGALDINTGAIALDSGALTITDAGAADSISGAINGRGRTVPKRARAS